MSMKPSELLTKARETSALPFYGSVFADRNYETVFINAIMICNRTGDEWGLSIETYTAEREKDGNFSQMEQRIAEKVLPYVADSNHGRKIHMEMGK